MTPRIPRRRKAGDDQPDEDPDAPVDLSDEAHAWWAQREDGDLIRPVDPARQPRPAEERDVLAEHLGPDWRTDFGFDRPGEPPPGYPDPAIDGTDAGSSAPSTPPDAAPPDARPLDPYDVLGVDPAASWEEIVAAHRAMARRHHPDRLVGGTDSERQAGEERIRDINAAFAELRIRRGR